jgi:uncharacterized protein (DUF2336 family)
LRNLPRSEFPNVNQSSSFLQNLDEAVSRGSSESRLRALWHATDVLMVGRFDEDEIWVFGEVIAKLVDEIEVAARARLAERLARSENAPIKIVQRLADDSLIEVAGPILRNSERLDVRALIAGAKSQSQQHLLAISKRNSISEAVTDVLVTRGNREVVHSVAANHGARFSEDGFLQLLKHSENDTILSEHLGQRRDIPRHVFQQMIAKASEDVRQKLEQENPHVGSQIQTAVTDVTGAMHSKFGPASKEYFAAKKLVSALHPYGNLGESKIYDFAQSRKLDEATIGLSLLCSLPPDVVERALADKNREMLLVLTKALDFSWQTTMSLLFLSAPNYQISAQDLDRANKEFRGLNIETPRSVLDFYRSRKAVSSKNSGPNRLPQLHAH